MTVIPRSHNLGPLEHIEEGNCHLSPDDWPIGRAEPVEADAEDVFQLPVGAWFGREPQPAPQEHVARASQGPADNLRRTRTRFLVGRA